MDFRSLTQSQTEDNELTLRDYRLITSFNQNNERQPANYPIEVTSVVRMNYYFLQDEVGV